MKVLVVPTNRQSTIQHFFDEWKGVGGWDHVILIEDGPSKSFDLNVDVPHTHFSWEDIDNEIFSRRDSAIRCFGFISAWKMGAEYILNLDDDCYPINKESSLFDEHIKEMSFPKWDCLVDDLPTRGYPYGDIPKIESKMHIGLWDGVPDYDAIQSLSREQPPKFTLPKNSRIVSSSQYIPVCGMNLCIHRDLIPAAYFPKMGEDSPYSRFDDIWGGIVIKKVADHMNYPVSVGPPFVYHSRASNPIENIVKEAPGIKANTYVWRLIDDVDLRGCNTVIDCLNLISDELSNNQDPYISQWGDSLEKWTNYFKQK